MFVRNAEGGALEPVNETFEFGLFYSDLDGTMHLGASIGVGPNVSHAQEGPEFPLGEWTHVAFSADGATLRVYRNGELVAQTNYADNINTPTIPWISVGARLADDGFGGLFPDASLPDYMEGAMDDIAVWTRGLTAKEVEAVYAQGALGQDVTTASIAYVKPEKPGDIGSGFENTFELTGMDIGIEGDPVVPGSSTISNTAVDVFDVDVTAGGSDIWGNSDAGHFVYTEWSGDFDASVEVTRLDVINQWSKAGISVRESLDPGSRRLYVNVDSAAVAPKDDPAATGANSYEMGVRVDTDGGTGNWDENGGEPRANVADSTLPAWIRVTRLGNKFTAYRSGDGMDWLKMGSITQEYPENAIVALGTTSHNNNGADFVTTANYRNFTIVPAVPDTTPPVVGIGFDGAQVTVTWDKGTLQSSGSVSGPWVDVEVIPTRGAAAIPATSPYTADATGPGQFYRVMN
jgi:hypothetical protein